MRRRLTILIMLIVITGCTKDYSDLPQLMVDFQWPEKNAYEISPTIMLSNIPTETKQLSVNMFDLDHRYNHGGGTVDYNGSQSIKAGALNKYLGPAPPHGAPRYEITVKAIDASGNVIAFGKKMRKYPPEP